MTWTDLNDLAQQQQRQQPAPQQEQQPDPNAPGGPAPDPRSFTQSPTNPARLASLEGGGGGGGGAGESDTDESLGDLNKTEKEREKEKQPDTEEETNYPPITFAPSIYKPAEANAPPERWGKKSPAVKMAEAYPNIAPGPDIPAPHEMYQENNVVTKSLSSWGPPDVARPAAEANFLSNPLAAIADAFSHGKFSHNYSQAALRGLVIQQHELAFRNQQSIDNLERHLNNYGIILYEEQHGIITASEAMRRAYEYAQSMPGGADDTAIQFLNAEGLRGLAGYQQWLNAQYQRMTATQSQLKKVAKVDDDINRMKSWGYEVTGGGVPGPGDIRVPDPSQFPGRGGGQPKQAGQPPAGQYVIRPGSFDESLAKDYNLSPRAVQAVHELYNGREAPNYADLAKGGRYSQELRDRMGQGLMALQQQEQTIMNGEGTAQQKLQRLHDLDPDWGARMAGYFDYSLNAETDETKAKGWLPHITALMKKLDPDWDAGNFKNLHEITEPKGDPQKLLRGIGNISQTYLNAMENLNAIGENKSVPRKVLETIAKNYLGGLDATQDIPWEYNALANNLVAFEVEASRLLSQTGVPRVTILQKLLSHVGNTYTNDVIRGVMQNEMRIAWSNYNQFQETWTGYSKRDSLVPGIGASGFETLRAIVRQDVNTGRFPEGDDVPNHVKAANPTTVNKRFDNDEYRKYHAPLTMPQIWELEDIIKRNEHSTDPAMQAQVQRARARIGVLQGLDRRVPSIDVPRQAQ